MSSLLLLLIAGFIAYILFSKNGGMGCCGTHHNHQRDGRHGNPVQRMDPSPGSQEEIIDLRKEDYQVLSGEDHYAAKGSQKAASDIPEAFAEKGGVR